MKRPRTAQHAGCRRSLIVSTIAGVALLGLLAVGGAAQASGHALSAGGRSHNPIAVAARELNLHETGQLHLVSHHDEVLLEEGSGSGTLNGHITVRLTLAYTQASVTFTAYT